MMTDGFAPRDGVVDVCALGLDKFHGRFVLMTRLKGNRNNVLPLHAMRGEYVLFGDPLVAWFFRPPVEARSMGKLHGDVLVPNVRHRFVVLTAISLTMRRTAAEQDSGGQSDWALCTGRAGAVVSAGLCSSVEPCADVAPQDSGSVCARGPARE